MMSQDQAIRKDYPKWLYLAAILTAIALFLGALVSSAFSNYDGGNNLDIIPASFTFFVIWSIIYLMQLVWLIYGVVFLFRKDASRIYLFERINFMPFGLYLLVIVCYVAEIIWFFTNFYSIVNFVLLLIMTSSQWSIVVWSMFELDKKSIQMIELNIKRDIFLVRLIIQNGCALFATWTTVATALGLAQLLNDKVNVEGTIASTVALSCLAAFLLVYFLVDVLLLKRLFIFEITPYLTIIWGLVGSLIEHVDTSRGLTRNNIFTIVLLVVTCLLFVIKLTLSVVYFKRSKWVQIDSETKMLPK